MLNLVVHFAATSVKGTTHKISVLQEKQMTDALRSRISPPPILVIPEDVFVIFLYICRGPLAENVATHNSVWLKVAVDPFLQTEA
jgi:hypothetical protein